MDTTLHQGTLLSELYVRIATRMIRQLIKQYPLILNLTRAAGVGSL